MEKDPIKNDRRAVRRERRQGEGTRCALCSYAGPAPLRRVDPSVFARHLEKHHLVGVKIDRVLVCWLCPTCHDEVTEDQRLHGVDLNPDPARPTAEEVRDDLLSLGPLLVRIGNKLIDDGYRLDAEISSWAHSTSEYESRDNCAAGLRRAEDPGGVP